MDAFLAEIKRRKVFRVAVAYAIVAWLVVQVVSVIAEPLSLPDWLDTVVIVLLLAGFPVAIVIGWAFDITSAGVVRTPSRETVISGYDWARRPYRSIRAIRGQLHFLVILCTLRVSTVRRSTYRDERQRPTQAR